MKGPRARPSFHGIVHILPLGALTMSYALPLEALTVSYASPLDALTVSYASPLEALTVSYASPLEALTVSYASPLEALTASYAYARCCVRVFLPRCRSTWTGRARSLSRLRGTWNQTRRCLGTLRRHGTHTTAGRCCPTQTCCWRAAPSRLVGGCGRRLKRVERAAGGPYTGIECEAGLWGTGQACARAMPCCGRWSGLRAWNKGNVQLDIASGHHVLWLMHDPCTSDLSTEQGG